MTSEKCAEAVDFYVEIMKMKKKLRYYQFIPGFMC